jgi:hypothetical protein
VVLRDPTRAGLLDALGGTGTRAAEAKAANERVEVIVYFSGHADDQGLMLGRELLSYRDLRDAVGALHADVGITILDACASGAITRLKGGTQHPPSLGRRERHPGYAFLTSSSENEAAQESERLRGSFFTHALLSGLRGAADVTGDGRVTLNEAYQFAFNETLVQTTTTQAARAAPGVRHQDGRHRRRRDDRRAQHVVAARLRRRLRRALRRPGTQPAAGGRALQAQGRRVELGLEPGSYGVYFEQEKQLLTTSVTLVDGQQQELVRATLKPTRRWPTQYRGHDGADPRDFLDGRVRVQGGWGPRFTFTHWLKGDLALALTFGDRIFEYGGERTVQLGAQYYPPVRGRVRPHFAAVIGRFDVRGEGVDTYRFNDTVYETPHHAPAVGFGLGAGVDSTSAGGSPSASTARAASRATRRTSAPG